MHGDDGGKKGVARREGKVAWHKNNWRINGERSGVVSCKSRADDGAYTDGGKGKLVLCVAPSINRYVVRKGKVPYNRGSQQEPTPELEEPTWREKFEAYGLEEYR